MESSSVGKNIKNVTSTIANKTMQGFSHVWNNLTDPEKMVEGMNESFASIVLIIMILISILLMVLQLYYTRNMGSSNCNRFDKLYSVLDGSISNISSATTNVAEDSPMNYQHQLRDYYIKTAYNSCSGGNSKNGVVSICVLKDLIKQGVRGFDFEVYSINNQPVVATSTVDSFYVKETYNYVPFSDVLLTLKNFAMGSATSTCPNPSDPVILHLRFKSSNQQMYTNFATLLKGMSGYMLGPEFSCEYSGCLIDASNNAMVSKNLGSVPLLQLCNKIVIIADKANSAFIENDSFREYVNMTSGSVFMRALSYYNVKFTPDMNELTNYNKQQMTIVLPDDGTNPANPSGILCRGLGCQMVAMRYQLTDQYLNEDTLFFNSSGHAFCLKPVPLRYMPVYIAAPTAPDPKLSYAARTTADPSGLYNYNT